MPVNVVRRHHLTSVLDGTGQAGQEGRGRRRLHLARREQTDGRLAGLLLLAELRRRLIVDCNGNLEYPNF